MKTIYYLSSSRLPIEEANAIHVINMSLAFSETGSKVELYIAGLVKDIPHSAGAINFKLTKPFKNSQVRSFVRIFYVLKDFFIKRKKGIVFGRDFLSISILALLGRDVYLEVHEPPSSKLRKYLFEKVIKRKSLRGIVVITEKLKHYFVENYGISPDLIMTAPDCANIKDKQQNGMNLKLGADGEFIVGYAGSLYPGKGVDFILEIAEKMPDTQFFIAGGSSHEISEMKKNAPKNVEFKGRLAHQDVDMFLEGCSVLLAPYKKRVESASGNDIGRWMSPLKIFEYMASGRPMIASDIDVIREVLENGVDSLLAEPENVSAWVEQITYLEKNLETRNRIAMNGYQSVKTQFTWHHRAAELKNFFQDKSV